MCICCAAIPITAAAGAALDNKTNKTNPSRTVGRTQVRPIAVLTILVLAVLMTLSIVLHSRFGFFW
jgi:hypothetical protein